MSTSRADEFTMEDLFLELGKRFPRQTLDEDSMLAYEKDWQAYLDDVGASPRLLYYAARMHARRSPYYPAISELIELAEQVRKAAEEREKVLERHRSVGKAKREAIAPGEAKSLLEELLSAASLPMPVSFSNLLSSGKIDYESGLTDDEWEDRVRRIKEQTEEVEVDRGPSPNCHV